MKIPASVAASEPGQQVIALPIPNEEIPQTIAGLRRVASHYGPKDMSWTAVTDAINLLERLAHKP
jgi:hypothetical protein